MVITSLFWELLLLQRFTQYLASNNCTFNLGQFLDKSAVQGMLRYYTHCMCVYTCPPVTIETLATMATVH